MMKKKVKKIPKYNVGTSGVNADYLNKISGGTPTINSSFAQQNMGTTGLSKDASAASGGSGFGGGWGAFGAAATAGGKMLMNAFGVEDNSQAGVTLNSSMQGAEIGGSIMPGWGHLIGGIAGGAIGAFKKGSVDVNTGEITSGGIFGRSMHSLKEEQNMIRNNIRAKAMTQGVQADYYNNPNVPIEVRVAEGGIMRKPVDALVSPGEIAINPYTLEYRQFGSDNEEPNSKDNIETVLEEGDNVKSHAKHMIMPNGKTPADNSKMVLDSNMPEEMKRKMIKKIDNWESAHRTKPQEYAKFGEGTHYVDGQRAIYRHGRWWWNEGGKKDAQGKMYFVPYTGKSTPSEKEPTKYTSETPVGPLDPAYRQHVRYSSTNDVERKATVSKPSSSKKTTTTSRVTTSTVPQEEKLTPEQIAESLRIADIGERHWLRGSVTEPKQSFTSLAKITPEKIKSQGIDNVAPLTGIKPSTDTTGTDSTGYTGSNWRDGLYRMAVLSQPLWDRAEAEPVNYESPVYKYMPTAIDVSSQLRDTDQSYALARYNFANLYPNTGAGMAAGLQAASNRAKQYADIRQWQTNAQNELIGKNVGIYNNWANEHARILNDVYNKTAANRAAARNINRQNRAAALSNYGQMLKDDKQFAMDTMKLQMMEPMMQYGYENYNDYLNWKKANGYG